MDERQEFIEGKRASYVADLGQFAGKVSITAVEILVAQWGGWSWEARGVDRYQASERLEERVAHRQPFFGDPMDWGPPGQATDDRFDESIPAQVQDRMREYQRVLDPNWPG